MFELLFVSLPPTLRTCFSSTKGSSKYNLLFCFSFATFLLLVKPSQLNSSANALFCATLINFFPAISISTMLRSCSNVPVCWCSTVVSLFGKAFLSKFVLNFKTNSNTFLILFQLDKHVSNVSSLSVFTSILQSLQFTSVSLSSTV